MELSRRIKFTNLPLYFSYRFLSPLAKLEKLLEKLNIERGEKMNRTKLAERDKNELKGKESSRGIEIAAAPSCLLLE